MVPMSAEHNLMSPWGRVRAALFRRGAHVTLAETQPGLGAAEVARGFEKMGLVTAGQAPELFAHANGSRGALRPVQLFPGMNLISLQRVIEVRETMLRSARMPSGYGYPKSAGWPAFQFIPEFVPIAEGERDLLVVDARGGSDHGRVFRYDKVLADDVSAAWPDLSCYLDEVAAAIGSGSSLQERTPVIRESRLHWIRFD